MNLIYCLSMIHFWCLTLGIEMDRFVTGVADLLKEECRTTILHNDLDLSKCLVYDQEIDESMIERLGRDLKEVGWRINANIGLKREPKIKMSQEFQRSKKRKVVNLNWLGLLVPLLVRDTMGNAYPLLVDVMVLD